MRQQTSMLAYKRVQPELGHRHEQIYKVLQSVGRANNTMLAAFLGLPISSITPRVGELRRMSGSSGGFLVVHDGVGVCPYSGYATIFWRCK